jgi:hypothetical protein
MVFTILRETVGLPQGKPRSKVLQHETNKKGGRSGMASSHAESENLLGPLIADCHAVGF